MKKILFMYLILCCVALQQASAQGIVNRLKQKVKDRANQKVDNKLDQAADKIVNAPENAVKSDGKDTTAATVAAPEAPPQTAEAGFKAYQNYDFVAGEKILFEDHFTGDQDGEFPSHWKLVKGQAVMNKVDSMPCMLLTEGNYAEVTPRMKAAHYLTDTFTLEFDFIYKKVTDIGYGDHSDAPGVEFYYNDPAYGETPFRVVLGLGDVKVGEMTKVYPDALLDGFQGKWHHAAIIYKAGQMKTYVDQYRVCINPNLLTKPLRISFDGAGSENAPIIFSNIKLALGGGMNMIGKKFTDAKIVTHGINFDVNKANIKPESMGAINGIMQILKDNPDIKFEIGGYTDSDGDDAANMKLSQARADAVRIQLVNMGIDASRLTSKGYGETKPISDNTSPEGKANNRRVEFVKL